MQLSDFDLVVAVTNSNAIEGINAIEGDPLFDQHLAAARFVRDEAPTRIIMPREIHRILMEGILDTAGEYRTTSEMTIGRWALGGKAMPRAAWVPRLMERYETDLNAHLRRRTADREERFSGVVFHHEGLCIHPFEDGNGRTFRLQWSAARLYLGLSWQIVCVTGQREYFRTIEAYEEKIFKPQHPDVY